MRRPTTAANLARSNKEGDVSPLIIRSRVDALHPTAPAAALNVPNLTRARETS